MKIDYLIVGQGLAGSILAWKLLERGKRILVIDRDEQITASKVAAGLVTPLSGSRPNISPAFENRLLTAKKFYWEAEETTGARFFHHLTILKLFRDSAESNRWSTCDLSGGSPLNPYLAPLPNKPELLHSEHGGFEMKGGGWLNVPVFLEATRHYLLERASYAIGNVNAGEIEISENCARWRNIEATRIIFAEGWRAGTNRFFDWLKMNNALGDILEVRVPALVDLTEIVNRGAWLLPLEGDRFRTGSNYRHGGTLESPDEEGGIEISGKLETITPHPYEIIEHQCAIRPIIRRSQIFCGIHPTHSSIVLMNGLGSKGVTNAPWYAGQLVAHLEEGASLPEECDLRSNLI